MGSAKPDNDETEHEEDEKRGRGDAAQRAPYAVEKAKAQDRRFSGGHWSLPLGGASRNFAMNTGERFDCELINSR